MAGDYSIQSTGVLFKLRELARGRQRRPAHRALARGLLAACALALAGCSATQMLYNNAPWWLQSEVDDYFGLNTDQRDRVGQQIEALFAWHRKGELPAYHRATRRFVAAYEDGLQRPELDRFVIAIKAARDRALQKTIPGIADFLAGVTPEQIDRFEQNLAADLEEGLAELKLDARQRRQSRFEEYLDRYETWYGELSTEQAEVLRGGVAAMPDFHAAWIEHRRTRQKELIDLLRTRPAGSEVEALLRAWWDDFKQGLNPRYRAARERVWEDVYQLIVRMDKGMSLDQRAHLAARAESYASDFYALANQ